MGELVRANRVSVQAEADRFKATFYRTHKVVATILSGDTTWVAKEDANKTAQREAFRSWICDHASDIGIVYDPVDRRDTPNMLPAKYTDDVILLATAGSLVQGDVQEWASKCATEWGIPLDVISVLGEEIVEVTKTKANKDVSPKYNNGNWAWATVTVTATVMSGDTEGYVSMKCDLVSGQLKKPSSIGELGYTFTGFKTELAKDLQALIQPKDTKVETPKVEEPKQEQPTTDEKTSKGKNKGKAKNKKDAGK